MKMYGCDGVDTGERGCWRRWWCCCPPIASYCRFLNRICLKMRYLYKPFHLFPVLAQDDIVELICDMSV
jgi:hypothetical protein